MNTVTISTEEYKRHLDNARELNELRKKDYSIVTEYYNKVMEDAEKKGKLLVFEKNYRTYSLYLPNDSGLTSKFFEAQQEYLAGRVDKKWKESLEKIPMWIRRIFS